MSHLNTPWVNKPHNLGLGDIVIYDESGKCLAVATPGPDAVQTASHIVRCVNSHEKLVKSLIDCLTIVRLKCGNLHEDTNQIQKDALDAIELATGESK